MNKNYKKYLTEICLSREGYDIEDVVKILMYSEFSFQEINMLLPDYLKLSKDNVRLFFLYLYEERGKTNTKEEFDFLNGKILDIFNSLNMECKYLLFIDSEIYGENPELFQEVFESFMEDTDTKSYSISLLNAINLPLIFYTTNPDDSRLYLNFSDSIEDIKLFCTYFLKNKRFVFFKYGAYRGFSLFTLHLRELAKNDLSEDDLINLVQSKDLDKYNIKKRELLIPLYFLENMKNYYNYLTINNHYLSGIEDMNESLQQYSHFIGHFLKDIDFVHSI